MNAAGARSWAEIDVEALRENARRFKKHLGKAELIAVVKANAYGHGAVDTAAALDGCVDRFAVASPDEAAQLRAGGVQKPILLLYPLLKEELEAALLAKAEISAAGADEIERADKTARRLKTTASIHIALNTGMNRYGADPGALLSLARQVERSASLRLAGVSTHFTEASIPDSAFTRQQLNVFLKAVREASLPSGTLLHAANTGAALNYPEAFLGAARIGIGIYGVYPHPKTLRSVELKPALSWKTRIAATARLKPGDSVAYHRSFKAERPMRVGVLPAGYADGFRPPRSSGKGVRVLTCGNAAHILGDVMMDACILDISDIPEAQPGSEAVLIGGSGDKRIGAEEAAAQLGTHPYELLAGISGRVRRIYLRREES